MDSKKRKQINEVLQGILDRHDTRDEFVFSQDTDDIIELIKKLLGLLEP